MAFCDERDFFRSSEEELPGEGGSGTVVVGDALADAVEVVWALVAAVAAAGRLGVAGARAAAVEEVRGMPDSGSDSRSLSASIVGSAADAGRVAGRDDEDAAAP